MKGALAFRRGNSVFRAICWQVWSDAEREGLQLYREQFEAGDQIPETGGVRKVRWGGET